MAAVGLARAATGMRISFAVPEGQDAAAWYRAQVEAYGAVPATGVAPSRIPTEQEVAWVTEAAFLVDAIHKPHLLTLADGQPTLTERFDTVGRTLPPTIFRAGVKQRDRALKAEWALTLNEPNLPAAARALEVERRRYALALVGCLREVVTTAGAREVPIERSSAWLGAVVVGGAVVLAVAFDGYLDHLRDVAQLQSDATERIARARVAQAAQDYAARLAAYNASPTHVMPPASPLEVAVAADVQRRATSEWDAFWTGAERTAGKLSKGLMVAAVAAAVVAIAK